MSLQLALAVLWILVASGLSLVFSSLTFALRDFSRPKLAEKLKALDNSAWFEPTVEQSGELTFVTAIGRLFANLFVFIGMLHLCRVCGVENEWVRYGVAVVVTSVLTLFVSVAIPHAVADHLAESLIANCVKFLHWMLIALLPATSVMRGVNSLISRLVADTSQPEQLEADLEKEILSVVEEGEKEGVVDEQEREMITSVIEFADTTVGQAMTPRPEIIGLPCTARLEQVKSVFAESGHSRLPVYDGSLDKIVGVLYARDLIRHLGAPPEQFDTRANMRSAVFVPKTKLLRELLQDFRSQKVHIAIVLDEYGGTAGMITIEDVLKELVGELSDEHEPSEPSLLHKVDDKTAEADGKIYIEQLNRVMNLNLPEDAGYETLGGFVSTTLGRIPDPGTSFDHNGVRYTITDAEPQRVNRVKVEVLDPTLAHAVTT